MYSKLISLSIAIETFMHIDNFMVCVIFVIIVCKAVVQIVADWFLRCYSFCRDFSSHVAKSCLVKCEALRVGRDKFRHAGLVGVVCGLATHFYKLIQIVVAVSLLRLVISCYGVKTIILVTKDIADRIKTIGYILVTLPPLVLSLYGIKPATGGVIIIFGERSVTVVYACPLSVLV